MLLDKDVANDAGLTQVAQEIKLGATLGMMYIQEQIKIVMVSMFKHL